MSPMAVATRKVRAPRGSQLSCLAWPQEAAFRMIQNNLDREVAEKPAFSRKPYANVSMPAAPNPKARASS